MKLMKHITIALVLCAIPAMAFAQTAGCTDCDHTVSYYKGTGGLIATAAEDAEKVGFVASCGGTTRTGELTPNDDGVVSMLLTGDYACNADKGSFDIGPITDGGWYWINDEDNSAIGNLVAKDTLDNTAVELTGAGDGVTMSAGSGAVFVKETATGRVGILPNILPDPPVPALRKCGADGAGTAASPFVRRTSACAMGDGGTITLATTYDGFRGSTTRLMDKGSITRPGGTASSVVTIDLWGNGSGHFTTDPEGLPLLGNPAVALTAQRDANNLTGVTYTGTLGTGGPGGSTLDSPAAGITLAATDGVATVTAVTDADYCSKTNNHTATVNITALMAAATDAAQVTPSVARNAAGVVGGISFDVMCPSGSGSAAQGQELVPDNPFPTDR